MRPGSREERVGDGRAACKLKTRRARICDGVHGCRQRRVGSRIVPWVIADFLIF